MYGMEKHFRCSNQEAGAISHYTEKLSNGMSLDCMPGHKWLIRTGNQRHPEQCITSEMETQTLNTTLVILLLNMNFHKSMDMMVMTMNSRIHICTDFSVEMVHIVINIQ